ncbi:uncharacterized protein LOC106172628 [Lingula anatina]|uniref:Uncharacterized protein LOC106172628 n=1 Tax=Lingula anatina TaxID=7574 RepID=A0A1S3JG48_LINAN|nr:uncharacterized protein LOC106172628 [Lingula anatina]|eukprot:XP_013408874.1 uncharacterized protein LOC106172628 [Lingula anatina]
MARYMANTQAQKFWEESITKEELARLQWFAKLRGQSTTEGKSRQYEVNRKKIDNAPKVNEDLQKRLPKIKPRQYHKKKADYSFNYAKLAAENPDAVLVEMRPVSPKTRELLYQGFTKEGRGRYQYLNQRYHQAIPEKKYSYPLLSSWEYGWRLEDVIKKEEIKKPQFGRTRIVADTFYTRTGIPTLSSY